MTVDFVVVPAEVCVQRNHPIKKNPARCLVCTLIWKIGGDEAVTAARRDPMVEMEWMVYVQKPDGSLGPMAR